MKIKNHNKSYEHWSFDLKYWEHDLKYLLISYTLFDKIQMISKQEIMT